MITSRNDSTQILKHVQAFYLNVNKSETSIIGKWNKIQMFKSHHVRRLKINSAIAVRYILFTKKYIYMMAMVMMARMVMVMRMAMYL